MAFHKVQELSSAVSRSKTTASYFTQPAPCARSRRAGRACARARHGPASSFSSSSSGADGARPQERAEQDVVWIGGRVAGQEFLLLQHAARGLERGPERRHPLLTRLRLEVREVRRAQPLAARFDDIGPVLRPHAIDQVADDERKQGGVHHRVRPAVDELARRTGWATMACPDRPRRDAGRSSSCPSPPWRRHGSPDRSATGRRRSSASREKPQGSSRHASPLCFIASLARQQ